MYLEALPPPSKLGIADKDKSSNPKQLVSILDAFNKTQSENVAKYGLEQPMVSGDRDEGRGAELAVVWPLCFKNDVPIQMVSSRVSMVRISDPAGIYGRFCKYRTMHLEISIIFYIIVGY